MTLRRTVLTARINKAPDNSALVVRANSDIQRQAARAKGWVAA
jgi:hypothetical protein